MRSDEWKSTLLQWADDADEGEDVSLDGDTLREIAGLIPVSAMPPCEAVINHED